MLKLYFQDASSDAAYEASLITRDRALAAQQQSIDLLQRLLSQMGDDPLLVMAKESLTKIIANPSVITDEVFSNIMSKTQEVMDANYDSQVNQFLDNARSKGVTGDTLAIQLQKAKNARAQGMAAAYRDAIVARAKEGLTTSIDAINTAFNAVNQSLTNQRVATEDLVNVYQNVVPEPFRNYGAPSQALPAGAGGAGGGVRYSSVQADYSGATLLNAFQESFNSGGTKPPSDFLGQPSGGATSAVGTLTDAQRYGLPETPALPTGITPGTELAKTGELGKDQWATLQKQTPAEPDRLQAVQRKIQQQLNGVQAPVALDANIASNVQASAQKSVNDMLAKSPANLRTNALTGYSYSTTNPTLDVVGVKPGYTAQQAMSTYKTAGDLSTRPQDMATLKGTGLPSTGVTMGGGIQEANRVANELIGQVNKQTGQIINPADIIGTSEGAGVRKMAEPVAKEEEYNPYENWKLLGNKWVPMNTAEIAAAAAEKKKTKAQQLAAKLAGTSITVSNPYGEGTVSGVRK